MHQDTKFDIQVCERSPIGEAKAARDLTQNWQYAESAIAIADRFFRFNFKHVSFSGFAVDDKTQTSLEVQVWDGKSQVYRIDFWNAGLEGTLYVDVKSDELSEALGQDVLGAIRRVVNQERGMKEDCPRYEKVEIDDYTMTLTMDLRP